MTKLLAAVTVIVGLSIGASTAQAGGSYYVGFHYAHGGYHHHWRHRHFGYYWPYWGYYGPPPVYYAPPPPVYYVPPREPYCVQDQVYRYLPDGRVQSGTRTRCY